MTPSQNLIRRTFCPLYLFYKVSWMYVLGLDASMRVIVDSSWTREGETYVSSAALRNHTVVHC